MIFGVNHELFVHFAHFAAGLLDAESSTLKVAGKRTGRIPGERNLRSPKLFYQRGRAADELSRRDIVGS